jgi:hypothetical protein
MTDRFSRDLDYVSSGVRFVENGHRYYLQDADGREERIVSATQALSLSGLREGYENVPPVVLKQASQRGTAVHAALPLLLEGNLDWQTVDRRIIGYVEQLAIALDDLKFQAWNCEDPVASIRLRVGCTPDGFGVPHAYDYGATILEVKTGSSTEKRSDSAILQATIYALAVAETVRRQRGEVIHPAKLILWLQRDSYRLESVKFSGQDEADAEAAVRVAWRHIRQSKGEFV